jgi:esterase/lipase
MNVRIIPLAATGFAIGGLISLALAACGPSHPAATASASARAHAAASALASSQQYQQDKQKLEAELTANFQKEFSPAHPVKSVQAAIKLTFPQGDLHKIEAYAVKTFTPAVGTTHGPGSPRDAYLNNIVVYALAQGAAPSASATP